VAFWLVVSALVPSGKVTAQGQGAESGEPAGQSSPADSSAATRPTDNPSLEAIVDRIYRRLAEEQPSARVGTRTAVDAQREPPEAADRTAPRPRAPEPATDAARITLSWRTVLIWPDELLEHSARPTPTPRVDLAWP